MKNHELKIWPEYYREVARGSKTFEYRINDRDFKEGDTVELREWNPKPSITAQFNPLTGVTFPINEVGYTGRSLKFRIGYVLHLNAGITEDRDNDVVFSLLPLKEDQK